MPYCLKCGAKVEDQMTFCPACGAPLKDTAPTQQPAEQPANPNPQPPEQASQPTKTAVPLNVKSVNVGFLKYLAAGLVLITIGASAILELTNPRIATGEFFAVILLMIGLIVILSGVYYLFAWRRHPSSSKAEEKPSDKNSTQPIT